MSLDTTPYAHRGSLPKTGRFLGRSPASGKQVAGGHRLPFSTARCYQAIACNIGTSSRARLEGEGQADVLRLGNPGIRWFDDGMGGSRSRAAVREHARQRLVAHPTVCANGRLCAPSSPTETACADFPLRLVAALPSRVSRHVRNLCLVRMCVPRAKAPEALINYSVEYNPDS